MSNIYKIAEKVGVSPSTVARALSGNGYCKQETKEKIMVAAKELNYSPVHAARTLKNKKSEKILFCIPDIYNPFYFGMIQGANEVFEKYGYFTVLVHTGHSIKKELKMIQSLRERYADGMILVSFNFCRENISAINKSGMPIVLTNRYDSPKGTDKFDYVYIDTKKGVRMATEHLISQKHKKIAFLGGNIKEQTGKERFEGYKEAMTNAGYEIDERLIFEGDYKRESGEQWTKKYLEMENQPTALVTTNDLMAIGAIKACHENGVAIPNDLAIIGMDDTYLSSCLVTPLSSVCMREHDIGYNAATLLMERINDGRDYQKKIKLEPELKIRDSSNRRT